MNTSPRTSLTTLLFLCALAVSACAEPSADAAAASDPAVAAGDGTPTLGAREPKVIVSLFTDYQCPNCRRAGDVAQRLLDRWPDEVQVRFHHLPLQDHPLAIDAAIAAQAAHRQGRFLCMHTSLAKTRAVWTNMAQDGFQNFLSDTLGPRCGLEAVSFARDRADTGLRDTVIASRERSRDLEVPGTPYLYVNGLEADAWPRPGRSQSVLVNSLVRAELRDIRAGGLGGELCDEDDWRCRVMARVVANTGDETKARLFLE